MDSQRDPGMTDDLSALAWVQDELRRSLDTAHKALRRFVKETQAQQGADVDVVDPAVLRTARQQFHQGVGALELVGLPAVAVVLRASESAVQKFIQRPQKLTVEAVEAIERASFAMLDYLSRLLAGKSLSPVAMFPQYRAVQELAGADRVHPADLSIEDWRWRELPADESAMPREADASTRAEIETHLLQVMRTGQSSTAATLSDLFAGLAATSGDPQTATLWGLAAGLFDGQAQGLLRSDNYSKRIGSRLLAQLRMTERGESAASDRLAQDLLFFCGQCQSPGDGRHAPRLAAVRQVYGLAHHEPVDYASSRLGMFDPALLVQARKRVAAAKDAWSSIAGGEMHRLAGVGEQFALVSDSLERLYPSGNVLAGELTQAVAHTVQQGEAPSVPLAMEVATSVLYLEASIEDGDLDHPQLGERIERLAARIAAVRSGQSPDPLESWMEELYRRVSDRQTMGSVVQELRIALSEAEKHIDQFFRDPSDRNMLIPVPGQLSAMRGVLSVLGMDQASSAVLRMREDIDHLIATEHSDVSFERLAGNLGALGFLIDMLSVQPQMAKSLFVFNAAEGTLSPVMGRELNAAGVAPGPSHVALPVQPRLIEQVQSLAMAAIREDVPVGEVSRDLERLSHEALVADQPALAATVAAAQAALERAEDEFDETAAREQLALAMNDFVVTASDAAALEQPPIVQRATPHVAAPSGLEEDTEMREVFLEEAHEVLAEAKDAVAQLAEGPADVVAPLTTVRRSFHTLKGSSRMVGLNDFGEAAWSCEQLFNALLAEAPQADDALIGFAAQALGYLDDWVEHIASGRSSGHDASDVRAAADALRLDGHARPLLLPASFAREEMEPLGMPPDLPAALDLELPPSFDLLTVAGAAPAAAETPAFEEVRFELNLRALDAPDVVELADMADAVASAAPGEDRGVETDEQATVPLPLVDEFAAAEVEVVDTDRLSIDLELDLVAPGEPAASLMEMSAERSMETPVEAAELTPAEAPGKAPAETAESAAPSAAHEPVVGEDDDLDHFKWIGPLRISIPLFNIYLNEADELSRRLMTEVAEWSMELDRPVGEAAIALAHSLGGSSATVGYVDLSQLARSLESALTRAHTIGQGTPEEARLFGDVAEEIRRLLHQFAAGFLKAPKPELLQGLAHYEIASLQRLRSSTTADAVSEDDRLEPRADAPTAETSTVVSELAPIEVAEIADDAFPRAAAEAEPLAEPSAPLASMPSPGDRQPRAADPVRPTALGSLGQAELKSFDELSLDSAHVPVRADAPDADDDIDAVDAVDAELFPIFDEEAQELLPQLSGRLRDWARRPGELALASACMRTLHTLKGGARLAGAMRLGELAHRLETAIEHLLARDSIRGEEVEALQGRGDALTATLESLRARDEQAYEEAVVAATVSAPQPLQDTPTAAIDAELGRFLATPGLPSAAEPLAPITSIEAFEPRRGETPSTTADTTQLPVEAPVSPAEIDWSRFAASAPRVTGGDRPTTAASQSAVRVSASLIERLVNQSGEVSITRSRIESEVGRIKGSLTDLTENLERLRGQLREVELQAETQMSSRMEAAKAAAETFDPLEFDRFTRFQELTRMMAESVNDVATVQRALQRTLEATEDQLASQARLTRDLQDDLLRTRMVEFEGLSERLYRVVRQAAKETGKQVRLDILGGRTEVDRGVLDRMTGAFEHLLRNCVTHGIERPEQRTSAGKDPTGKIIVALSHAGNEVGVEFRDDGQGLDLQRINARGIATGLLDANVSHSEAELANLIFAPGFSTADVVTELAGRGIGMDVVRSEVNAMGGRIETATAWGQGTSFKLLLPLTTAVTQVVMLRCADANVAVPSALVEVVRRATPAEIADAYASGTFPVGDRNLPFFWFGALLQMSARGFETGRTLPVVVIRSAQQRIVLHVDEVLGNQEVVVKNLGPQLSRMPGLAGMTLLAAGVPALIYNPVALATLYGDRASALTRSALDAPAPTTPMEREQAVVQAPLILVVDDSLTVRRVTQRLLVREGYRVQLAKDGLEALAFLADERPSMVLSDIEMPRMDGFDLVRNLRGDARWRDLPVVMITSRIAQKHRDHAAELGVDHYLGKPYAEEDLLALISRYVGAETVS
jgi:chemosensory pili system protein ChpA (sensor histidine kinase/response regulator)